MSKKILVTDSLFIFEEHVKQLESASFEVIRLDKPEATEAELCDAIKGKAGYILGGIEHVTEPVIQAADQLQAIVFTGADWAGYIPAHESATRKGIAIANTPGANTYAVAEYTLTLALMMLRRTLELGRLGEKTFMTAPSLKDVHIGIIGMGLIGEQFTRMLVSFGAKKISYWNRTPKPKLENELKISFLPLEDLLSSCDLISTHVSSQAGQLINKLFVQKMKKGAVVINTGSHIAIDMDALYQQIVNNDVRIAVDYPLSEEHFQALPAYKCFFSNSGTAFNTIAAGKLASDMATTSLINILTKGTDPYVVNSQALDKA